MNEYPWNITLGEFVLLLMLVMFVAGEVIVSAVPQ